MAANMCIQQNCTDSTGFLYEMITQEMWIPWQTTVEYFDYTWLFSLLGSTMIGLTGIFPLLVIPIEEGADIKTGGNMINIFFLLIPKDSLFLRCHVIFFSQHEPTMIHMES